MTWREIFLWPLAIFVGAFLLACISSWATYLREGHTFDWLIRDVGLNVISCAILYIVALIVGAILKWAEAK